MCQQMFFMFVKNRKNFPWFSEPVPAMPLYQASDAIPADSDSECMYFVHDIPNAAHIEREYGVTQLQRVKVFQRMTVYGTVAKDVLGNMWKGIPKAMEAVEAEWGCLRAQNVWDEAHPRTLGSIQSKATRNNKTILIGCLFDLCDETRSELAAYLRK